jgi:hypothetical protein
MIYWNSTMTGSIVYGLATLLSVVSLAQQLPRPNILLLWIDYGDNGVGCGKANTKLFATDPTRSKSLR